MRYDCIVIGAGNGGLLSALALQNAGKRVLLLEKNHQVGGLSSSFTRGRFTFNISDFDLFSLGSDQNPNSLFSVFQDLHLMDYCSFSTLKEAYYVTALDTNEKYSMPFDVSKYLLKMEEYVPGSIDSIQDFFDLAKEVDDAILYLRAHPSVDEDYMITNYPNFVKVSSYSVDMVLDALKMPKKAQNILTSCWSSFGSPTNTLSFVHFASSMYQFIHFGSTKLEMSGSSLCEMISSQFERLGGVLQFNTSVSEVLFEDGKVHGVLCDDGTKYYAGHIVSNVSPSIFYGKMIPLESQVDNANRLCNARTLGAQGVSLYLGLNQSAEDLGLTHSRYIICDELDSNKEYLKLKELFHDFCVVTVISNSNENDAPSTILHFSSLFFDDTFSKNVTEMNYHSVKMQIAERFIDAFEEGTDVVIRDAIEEIEVATPVTFSRFGGIPNGSIYGYMPKGYDNLLPRLLNESNEEYIPNVHFCGAFGTWFSMAGDTYLSGYDAAQKTLKDMEGEDISYGTSGE